MIHSEQGESQIYFSAFHNNPNSCEQLAKAQVFLTLARSRESNHLTRSVEYITRHEAVAYILLDEFH